MLNDLESNSYRRLTLPEEAETLSEDGAWEADWHSDHEVEDAGELPGGL